MPKIVELDMLEKVIRAVLYSAYVKDEKPLSLLIVAKPESAKTLVMKKYRENKGIAYLTDCTAFGLTRDILPKVAIGEIKHILIADIITPLSKSVRTRQSFVAFLNNLIEEGIAKMTSYVTSWDKEARCGMIAAVTDQELRDGRHEWAKMGFLSRMFIFSYSYPIDVVYKIFNCLVPDKSGIEEKVPLEFPKEPVDVILPDAISKEMISISMKVGESMHVYGLRFFANTKTILKSLALIKGKRNPTVTKEEVDEFLGMSRYLNCEFNPI